MKRTGKHQAEQQFQTQLSRRASARWTRDGLKILDLVKKNGHRGGFTLSGLVQIASSDGTNLAQLFELECIELLAPLVNGLYYQEMSSMTDAMLAGDTTAGTTAFCEAAVPHVMAAWDLEGFRATLFYMRKGRMHYCLPSPSRVPQGTSNPSLPRHLSADWIGCRGSRLLPLRGGRW